MFGKVVRVARGVLDDQYSIEKGNLASGIYFIKAYDSSGNVATGKFVVE